MEKRDIVIGPRVEKLEHMIPGEIYCWSDGIDNNYIWMIQEVVLNGSDPHLTGFRYDKTDGTVAAHHDVLNWEEYYDYNWHYSCDPLEVFVRQVRQEAG